MPFRPGQLWTSGAEPELGLGVVVSADVRSVELTFDGADCRRHYARGSAPLVRAHFEVGDELVARDGSRFVVRAIEEEAGLRVYLGGEGKRLAEADVAPMQCAAGPVERLRRGEVAPGSLFELRQEAFAHRHRLASSPIRGLVGSRIRLLPHQLFIASEVSGRDAPRVLLADEVGLGKTIEAGLVASRLIATGRVERMLVVTPEHLVHQWFVELLRRFNLRFKIFDEERCAAVESSSGGNPFLDEQFVLCGLPLLAGPGGRGTQAVEAGWDLVVVDEVHHLSWAPGKPSPGYAAVAALARSAAGVLLLSGTPSRRGEQSHFARLHLLDPIRHPDWESHLAETAREEEAARLVALAASAEAVPDDGSLVLDGGDREAEVVALDRFGPGRALFRNTRASVGGFPRRIARPAPLDASGVDPKVLDAIAREVASDPSARGPTGVASPVEETIAVVPGDPRVRWLAELIRRTAPGKILVIARTAGQVLSLVDALEREISVKRAVFHEGMTLVQRDRQAAWFAESDGARVLLSSEIGGEGRNFQFAHHLVLFDLPLDPEQLEQRIGRLDRIGQEHDVEIHVPFVVGSAHEVLHRWYADGLDAFERPAPDGNAFLDRFGARLVEFATARHRAVGDARVANEEAVERLVRETRAMRDEVAARHAAGRDRLLERASFRRAEAASIVGAIAAQDADRTLREFLERAFDHAAVEVEDLGPGLWRLAVDETSEESFPGIGPEGATATFDREIACRREDTEFLTWDHPIAVGAIEGLLSSPAGTLALATFAGEPAGEPIVEAFFVLETSAPARLGLARFLPSTPLRVAIDRGSGHGTRTFAARDDALRDVPPMLAGEVLARLRPDVETMLDAVRSAAEASAERLVAEALGRARTHFAAEIERVETLVAPGDPGRLALLAAVVRLAEEAEAWIRSARPRLDAVRILVASDAGRRPGE